MSDNITKLDLPALPANIPREVKLSFNILREWSEKVATITENISKKDKQASTIIYNQLITQADSNIALIVAMSL
jgi:hypothetical protein